MTFYEVIKREYNKKIYRQAQNGCPRKGYVAALKEIKAPVLHRLFK